LTRCGLPKGGRPAASKVRAQPYLSRSSNSGGAQGTAPAAVQAIDSRPFDAIKFADDDCEFALDC
jgi:hypothetical protein